MPKPMHLTTTLYDIDYSQTMWPRKYGPEYPDLDLSVGCLGIFGHTEEVY